MSSKPYLIFALCTTVVGSVFHATYSQDLINNPDRLELKGDIASELVSGVDRFLLQQIEETSTARVQNWKQEFAAAESRVEFFKSKRQKLAQILGVRDPRVDYESPELITTLKKNSLLGKSESFEIHAIRIPVLDGVHLEGLLLRPTQQKITGQTVVVPDADQLPEALAGLTDDLPESEQIARQLANRGHLVVVPTLISREMQRRNGRANLTHREYLYRPAFELGRHLIGYEVQKILAVVDWFESNDRLAQIGVWGSGEGGMLAMYAAAIDDRIKKVAIDDYLGNRQNSWKHPISRNVFGLLKDFGDAELLSMISPRQILQIQNPAGVTVSLPSEGGAPAELKPATAAGIAAVESELRKLADQLSLPRTVVHVRDRDAQWAGAIKLFSGHLKPAVTDLKIEPTKPMQLDKIEQLGNVDARKRLQRQVSEIDEFNQELLAQSETVRRQFFQKLDTSSVKSFEKSIEPYRQKFATEVIGQFQLPLKKFNCRARLFCDKEKYIGYEVVLDVFDDVIAYGIILLPKGMKPDERRPVVVCQHGLEGRPQDIVQGNHRAYHDFAAKLAEQGYITFSPQNLYIFRDRFRTLQRKANTIGKTLFSVIVPQHQQIVNWLKSLPNVDSQRIAFYGLSYGGKSAMRIPPLVPDYCLSICSADFNEWVWKNASTSSNYSYVWTGEYEIFEFDLGSTFNYSEMAALIAPRPFMVERGHFDGVSSDERVAYEFAKVRHLYQAKLGIGDRCEIEFFTGPHTINGKGTFAFLRKHLKWPENQ